MYIPFFFGFYSITERRCSEHAEDWGQGNGNFMYIGMDSLP